MPRKWSRLLALVAGLVLVAGGAGPAAAQTPGSPGSTGSTGSTGSGTAVTGGAKVPLTPVLSARRVPGLLTSRVSGEALRQDTDAVLKDAAPLSCVVITDHGRVVLRAFGDVPLIPASNQKLLTAVAALELLGADTRLVTVVKGPKPGPDGKVTGDLHLVGGGDPLLFTPGFLPSLKNRQQVHTDFGALADRLKASGVTGVTGGVAGDDSRYDAQRAVPTWSPTYQRDEQVGTLSALEVNRGETGLSKQPDQPARVRRPGDPPVLAAETLISLLKARGVAVSGPPSSGPAPADSVELARLESLPVRDLVAEMLTESDNTTAELLAKEMGLKTAGQGTTAAGTAAMTKVVKDMGLPAAGMVLVDGSGLDRANRLSCDLLAAFLDKLGPSSPVLVGMPRAGENGTLKDRMKGSFAAGRVRAKTGSLNEVSALAGFVTTLKGQELTFSIIQNGGARKPPTQVEDALMNAVLTYPKTIDPAFIGPKQP